MLSPVNRIVHLQVKLDIADPTINGFEAWIEQRMASLVAALARAFVHQVQASACEVVEEARSELVCTGCGVVSVGRQGWSLRGSRERVVKTSRGGMRLPLLQSTCLACGKTRAPWADALGLGNRRRVTEALVRKAVERVSHLSYRRAADTVAECLGVSIAPSTLHRYVQETAARVELTPDENAEIVIADGTKVRAGARKALEDLRLGFQLAGRSQEGSRTRANLRLIGLDVGLGTWVSVLRGDLRTKVVITDAEAAVESHIRERYPNARHQFCEWHVSYSLNYSLRADGVPLEERRALQREMNRILWGRSTQRRKRTLYDRFMARMKPHVTTYKQLRRASDHILFAEPSPERTSSLVERQMREVDRRVWIGARWSVQGMRNLLLLSLAKTHNPDDYARAWTH